MKKSVLVTGGTSGIGNSVARRFLDAGWRVAICGRTVSDPSSYEPLLAFCCDVRSASETEAAVERVMAEFGRIDVLVNSAGISMPEPARIGEISPELWDSIIATSATGTFNFCNAVIPHMRTAGSGIIINVLSTASHRALAGNAPYTASKYAVLAMTETLRLECEGSGIRIGSVSPGPVDTNIWSHKTRRIGEDERRRMLAPDDIADLIEFIVTRPSHVRLGDIIITPSQEDRK